MRRILFIFDVQDQSSQRGLHFSSKPHFWAAHLWVWPFLIKRAILTTKTLKKVLIFPMCCFFSSVLGAPSPSCFPISLNSCLVRRGGNTWAGFACSGWLVAFMLQQWLGASSHITVICAFDFLHHRIPTSLTTPPQTLAQVVTALTHPNININWYLKCSQVS